MARALVVFESMFGSTEAVASAIADGLRDLVEADVVRAGRDVTVADDLDLLVVGGPTHAFGMSRPATRASAAQQGADAATAAGPGLREWLAGVRPPEGLAVAAFDTRIRKRGVPGSAARAAQRRLRKDGGRVLEPAESFWVSDTPGPLLDGETDRARRWGHRLAEDLVAHQGVPA